MANEDRPAPQVEVVLSERERFLDPRPGAPQDDDHRSRPRAVTIVGRVAHDRHDREHDEDGTAEFERLIGRAANARSFMAVALARYHRRSAASTVEQLGTDAVRTFTELVRVGRVYGQADLRLVSAQVDRALEFLRE